MRSRQDGLPDQLGQRIEQMRSAGYALDDLDRQVVDWSRGQDSISEVVFSGLLIPPAGALIAGVILYRPLGGVLLALAMSLSIILVSRVSIWESRRKERPPTGARSPDEGRQNWNTSGTEPGGTR